MISLYSGTPGSGKSLHMVKRICEVLALGRNVIVNFPVRLTDKQYKRYTGKIFYIPEEPLNEAEQIELMYAAKEQHFNYIENSYLCVEFLVWFALTYHAKGKENQTYIMIDEAQRFFNPREFDRSDRLTWCKFFATHRHLGFSVIFATPHDRLLDRQIRYTIEVEIKHRSMSNFKTLGRMLGCLGIKYFIAVRYWYAVKGEKDGFSIFKYHKKYSKMYDSYALFNSEGKSQNTDGCFGGGLGVPTKLTASELQRKLHCIQRIEYVFEQIQKVKAQEQLYHKVS